MRNQRMAWLAWALCGLIACLASISTGFNLWNQVGSKNAIQLANDAIFSLIVPIVFVVVAALIVSRQPRNTIGWLLLVPVGLALVDVPIKNYLQQLAPSAPAPTLPLLLMVWFSSWNWLLLMFPLLHIPLLFPNGQPPTPRWRWVSIAALAWAGMFVLMVTFSQPTEANTRPALILDNPIGVLTEDTLDGLIGVWIAGLLTLIILCVVALFVRYQRAHQTERKQIKWLLYACAMFAVVYVGGFMSGLADTVSFAGYVYNFFFWLILLTFPVAIGIAILRHGLYDIDIIIRRTLVYSTLTLTLGLVYIGLVVLLQRLVVPLTGGSEVTIVASTLAIAALFTPLRRRIQTIIDRRFYRRKYDAAKVLAAFGATARDETDLGHLADEMLRVVHETVQPEFVGLWLKDADSLAPGTKQL